MSAPQPPDSHHLSAAIGWLELGNPREAKIELDRISSDTRQHPDVLEVTWLICVEQDDWSQGLAVANALVEADPERPSGWLHRAYSLRRLTTGGLKAAADALRPAYDKFPKEPVIAFNLSCYACQMGLLDDARAWLQRAIQSGSPETIKLMALRDPDLKSLWAEIDKL
jgi:Flp pilus assembly protein TadD